eukprot:1160494-Pelagomonas_calceolata.AAC.15
MLAGGVLVCSKVWDEGRELLALPLPPPHAHNTAPYACLQMMRMCATRYGMKAGSCWHPSERCCWMHAPFSLPTRGPTCSCWARLRMAPLQQARRTHTCR